LVKSIPSYVQRSIMVIARIFLTYRPFAAFGTIAGVALLGGLLLGGRFLWHYAAGQGAGHVQSVILSALLLGSGLFLLTIGIVLDLISVNRRLLEKIDLRLHRLELDTAAGAQRAAARQAFDSMPQLSEQPTSQATPRGESVISTITPALARRG
jgi:hypothetical protein